ncbi:hypothetical protein FC697_17180 [Bacillus wiedmannii]|uniref:hypothetical protein n=1 Tax=Bacillus wiedmannii TaxID=1890302 RepID=UPI0010BDD2BC|nr:hypothetical protein [Bacillus wiedmannii]TKH20858.1 hypothetical protein FC697_17180 [Bacillus wiedmannii]
MNLDILIDFLKLFYIPLMLLIMPIVAVFFLFKLIRMVINVDSYMSSRSSMWEDDYSLKVNLNKSFVMDHREEKENKYSKGDSEMMKRVFKQNNSVSINQSGSNSYQREMAKKNNKRNSSSGSSSSDNSSVLLGTAIGVAVASSYYSDSSSSSSSCSHDSGSSFDCGGW